MLLSYPDNLVDRDRWILARRAQRVQLNPRKPYSYFLEDEHSADGTVVPVATIMLTNTECPFRCVMCDLWRNTLAEPTQPGAIPEQIEFALDRLPPAKIVKLYNSGSFFDPRAVPVEDYPAIAMQIRNLDRAIVECHPAFIGTHCLQLRELFGGRLEIAMGLETAHPDVLAKLNKRMTLNQFADAASFLRRNNIDFRVFILVQPPFMSKGAALKWARRSLDFAFDQGAIAATLIPTRGGNGAMETLAANTLFSPPSISMLEEAMNYGLDLHRGRVLADLWDIRRNSECALCFDKRVERLRAMNLTQKIADPVRCRVCEAA